MVNIKDYFLSSSKLNSLLTNKTILSASVFAFATGLSTGWCCAGPIQMVWSFFDRNTVVVIRVT